MLFEVIPSLLPGPLFECIKRVFHVVLGSRSACSVFRGSEWMGIAALREGGKPWLSDASGRAVCAGPKETEISADGELSMFGVSL